MAKTPPTPNPPAPPAREVWFSCRATPGCEGKYAKVIRSFGVSGQGTSTHYRCVICNGSWVVNV